MIIRLSERMRSYEQKIKLPENLPVIIRVDGKAFHTLTRKMKKPFDIDFIDTMDKVALVLCKEVQNCRMAYVQSDEINLLVHQKQGAHPWFNNEIQKIASVTAAMAASVYTNFSSDVKKDKTLVAFDSRVFVLPPKEVTNYFIWRQLDWERNSIQMLARSHFSAKELNGISSLKILEMLKEEGSDWNNALPYLKRGRTAIKVKSTEMTRVGIKPEQFERSKWMIDMSVPKFTDDRDYIESKMEDDFALKLGHNVFEDKPFYSGVTL